MPLLHEDHILETAYVIIYVWKARLNPASVGHVSIQTPNTYISLFPNKDDFNSTSFFGAITDSPRGSFHPSYKHDVDEEEFREADEVLRLYSLDWEEIEEKFNTLESKKIQWTLVRGKYVLNKGEKESCASIILKLLKEGGFEELIKKDKSLSSLITSSVITPDEMARLAKVAKQTELNTFPNTKQYASKDGPRTSAQSECCCLIV